MRNCIVGLGETKVAYPTGPHTLTPPVKPKPELFKAAPPQTHHTSLSLLSETVKKPREHLKFGIAFGTVAMAERGPYDQGMKDGGRIITTVGSGQGRIRDGCVAPNGVLATHPQLLNARRTSLMRRQIKFSSPTLFSTLAVTPSRLSSSSPIYPS
ncbi:hypothetical protein M407DRAFT_34321 [Tulasnella calospora MUT 4182]|uniref:Uncharacterized protein n=1 Tax=Tulasnella calospora MUT 4182 TaxID=1051891 RepID=A0A0C3Q1G7_9AGAM|nr:hypothetical protein M407DRAFT_34321 [Tulasnella calospora MUT 4182]